MIAVRINDRQHGCKIAVRHVNVPAVILRAVSLRFCEGCNKIGGGGGNIVGRTDNRDIPRAAGVE